MKSNHFPFAAAIILTCALLTVATAFAQPLGASAMPSTDLLAVHGATDLPYALYLPVTATNTVYLPALVGQTMPEPVAVAAGLRHTCALTGAGSMKCWGSNKDGQLGDGGGGILCGAGEYTYLCHTTSVDVAGMSSGVIALAAGGFSTCALTSAGAAKCWGHNQFGQLGDGTTTDRIVPVEVEGLGSGVTAIAASGEHTCALTNAGGVTCWGWNFGGQLGDGTTIDRSIPVEVEGLSSGVSAVAAGGSHTCALTSAGGVKCWGWNYLGPLGDGTTTSSSTPVDVVGLSSGVTAIAAGFDHTCALTNTGGVKCWGYNAFNQIGDGGGGTSCGEYYDLSWCRTTPVDVQGLNSGVIAVAASAYGSCALTSAGGVKCWGLHYGSVPVDVQGLSSGIIGVAIGLEHTCALTTVGGVKCWGQNSSGELGDGTTTYRATPVDVIWP